MLLFLFLQLLHIFFSQRYIPLLRPFYCNQHQHDQYQSPCYIAQLRSNYHHGIQSVDPLIMRMMIILLETQNLKEEKYANMPRYLQIEQLTTWPQLDFHQNFALHQTAFLIFYNYLLPYF